MKKNRILGAEKRKRKVNGKKSVQKDPEYFCNVCGHIYVEEMRKFRIKLRVMFAATGYIMNVLALQLNQRNLNILTVCNS